jgi:hypothetical protein
VDVICREVRFLNYVSNGSFFTVHYSHSLVHDSRRGLIVRNHMAIVFIFLGVLLFVGLISMTHTDSHTNKYDLH